MPAPDTLTQAAQDGASPAGRSEGGHPNQGRWVWCPPGWRVVPEIPTDDMLDAWDAAEIIGDDETVYRAIIATAPTPPSGWSRDIPPWGKPILAQRWSRTTVFEVIIAYTKGKTSGYWWTPLPPGPEDKP